MIRVLAGMQTRTRWIVRVGVTPVPVSTLGVPSGKDMLRIPVAGHRLSSPLDQKPRGSTPALGFRLGRAVNTGTRWTNRGACALARTSGAEVTAWTSSTVSQRHQAG